MQAVEVTASSESITLTKGFRAFSIESGMLQSMGMLTGYPDQRAHEEVWEHMPEVDTVPMLGKLQARGLLPQTSRNMLGWCKVSSASLLSDSFWVDSGFQI